MNKTRLFFVVSSEGSNEELFETLEQADTYRQKVLGTERGSLLRVAIVKNAYLEDEYPDDKRQWNYEDKHDTFNFIKNL